MLSLRLLHRSLSSKWPSLLKQSAIWLAHECQVQHYHAGGDSGTMLCDPFVILILSFLIFFHIISILLLDIFFSGCTPYISNNFYLLIVHPAFTQNFHKKCVLLISNQRMLLPFKKLPGAKEGS